MLPDEPIVLEPAKETSRRLSYRELADELRDHDWKPLRSKHRSWATRVGYPSLGIITAASVLLMLFVPYDAGEALLLLGVGGLWAHVVFGADFGGIPI